MSQPETALVTGRDGLRGRIVDLVQPTEAGERQVLVQFDNNQRVLVPFEELILQDDGSYYLSIGLDELQQQASGPEGEFKEPTVLPVVEEQLRVDKRQVVILS